MYPPIINCGLAPPEVEPEEQDPLDFIDLEDFTADPCPECGETSYCGLDPEGRPYIHVVKHDED